MTGRERVPAHIFLRAVDLVSAQPDSSEPDEVRRAKALRTTAVIVSAVSAEARERAARALEHAAALRSKSARLLGEAVQAAISRTEAQRGNVQLLRDGGLRIVA